MTDPPRQLRLSDAEKQRLPFGNQHTDDLTLLQWRTVKAAALRYGVPDWTSIADATLTLDENVELMRQSGTKNGGPTLRELEYATR